jgi:hypothetical protein
MADTNVKADGGGLRYDTGKLPVSLIAPEALARMLVPRADDAGKAMRYLAAWYSQGADRTDHYVLGTALEYAFRALETGTGSPGAALDSLMRVLEFGAFKYAARNWERGMAFSRCYEPALRHWMAHERGEDINYEQHTKDGETRTSDEPHLTHFLCNVMFLYTYVQRNVGQDDRPAVVAERAQ